MKNDIDGLKDEELPQAKKRLGYYMTYIGEDVIELLLSVFR